MRSLSPCSTPSHVCIPPLDLTGIVPSPDSILVRSWPRALRLGWRSAELAPFVDPDPFSPSPEFISWGANIRASPHGEVLMYKWNWYPSLTLKPGPSSGGLTSNMDSWAVSGSRCRSSCLRRYRRRHRRATTSAWQSFKAIPVLLMYSPLIHLVPVVTQITWVSSTSSLLPFVKTTPARTFRRAYGDAKLFVSSPNLARTREATRSASTCGRWGVPSPGATGCKPVGKNKV